MNVAHACPCPLQEPRICQVWELRCQECPSVPTQEPEERKGALSLQPAA